MASELNSPPEEAKYRLIIENISPQINGGAYPIKRVVGECVTVSADIFTDGHDIVAAAVLWRRRTEQQWHETPLVARGNDFWDAAFVIESEEPYLYTVAAWIDRFAGWKELVIKKLRVGQSVKSELLEGAQLLYEVLENVKDKDKRSILEKQIDLLSIAPEPDALEIVLNDEFEQLIKEAEKRWALCIYPKEFEVWVDRERARFSSWYELFPRSSGSSTDRSATFRDAEALLPYVSDLGFDVLYLPPIHPIGESHRKGRNNSLAASDTDPGSPWAIGSVAGGHKAVHPELGTLEEFQDFVISAQEHGLEVALDIAFQCSPDHPYVKEHPDWFFQRPDGSIHYAENPPKKYQDIYPLNFECEDWQALWQELLSVFLHWIRQGVRIFRVDNPHTKPFSFWQWVIAEIRKDHPDIIFLSEAFTRPKRMAALAKLGFNQSYSYFTWRNTKAELTDYLTELTSTDLSEYFRPNFFTNTPDILSEYLQHGGEAAFKIRVFLAATLSSNYGVYSGFEFYENVAAHPGSEEYLNSEKYEIRSRDWHRDTAVKEIIRTLNQLRRTYPALQQTNNLEFFPIDNGDMLAYLKRDPNEERHLLCIVTLNTNHVREATLSVPMDRIGLAWDENFLVNDLLSGQTFHWHGSHNYVRLDPRQLPAHLLEVVR